MEARSHQTCADTYSNNLYASKYRNSLKYKNIKDIIMHLSHVPILILKDIPMKRSRRRTTSSSSVRRAWYPRACVRRVVTLRVDYATAQGRACLGMARNLSAQGMYIDSALRHVAHAVAPGDLLTLAVVLPSGQPCTLLALAVHGDRHGGGVQFRQGPPQALVHLSHYWASLETVKVEY
jgi:hypothetical protein